MTSASSTSRLVSLWLAVLAGYVTVLATAPVAANVRLVQLDPVNATAWYSMIAASGALSAAIGYVVFGKLSNHLRNRRGTRQPIFIFSLLVLTPTGYLLSIADTVATIWVLWCVVVLPASAILSASTAIVLEVTPMHRIGLASGLFGAGAVIALLYGVVIGTVSNNNPQIVLLVGTLTAAALCIPAAIQKENVAEVTAANDKKFRVTKPFALFLVGTFAAMAALAVFNDYFFQIAKRLDGSNVQAVAELAQGFIAVSSVALLLGSIVGGLLTRTARQSRTLFMVSLLLAALALLAMSLAPNANFVMVAAFVGGGSAGLNLASQLPFMKASLGEKAELGLESGAFNLVSVVPSILMPAIGALLVNVSPQNWLLFMSLFVLTLALVGLALARAIRVS